MYLMVFVLWPVSVCIAIYMLYQDRKSETWSPDPQDAFTCQSKHLVAVLTPESAESINRIVDPRGRVPDVPFGHLNTGWRALIDSMKEGDELWSFEVPGYAPGPGEPPSRHKWALARGTERGYALVASGKVKAEFVYEWD